MFDIEEDKRKLLESFIEQNEKDTFAINILKKNLDDIHSWEELKVYIADNYLWLSKYQLPNGYYKTSNIEFTVVNGKLDGEFKCFHKNGKLSSIQRYNNGVRDGFYEMFNDKGNRYFYELYKEGQFVKKSSLHLFDTPYDYYCEPTYYEKYETFNDFIEEMKDYDIDLNFPFRFKFDECDERENGEKCYSLSIFIILQRKGRITQHEIKKVKHEDEPAIREYLEGCWTHIKNYWKPISEGV
jgi:hypothetical protein